MIALTKYTWREKIFPDRGEFSGPFEVNAYLFPHLIYKILCFQLRFVVGAFSCHMFATELKTSETGIFVPIFHFPNTYFPKCFFFFPQK